VFLSAWPLCSCLSSSFYPILSGGSLSLPCHYQWRRTTGHRRFQLCVAINSPWKATPSRLYKGISSGPTYLGVRNGPILSVWVGSWTPKWGMSGCVCVCRGGQPNGRADTFIAHLAGMQVPTTEARRRRKIPARATVAARNFEGRAGQCFPPAVPARPPTFPAGAGTL
jgi:hypothetical protein